MTDNTTQELPESLEQAIDTYRNHAMANEVNHMHRANLRNAFVAWGDQREQEGIKKCLEIARANECDDRGCSCGASNRVVEVIAALLTPEPPKPAAPTTHVLKTWPKYYQAIRKGDKRFEVRLNDRGFKVGDYLLLREWHPASEAYTGNELYVAVAYMIDGGQWGIDPSWCVMGIEPCDTCSASPAPSTLSPETER